MFIILCIVLFFIFYFFYCFFFFFFFKQKTAYEMLRSLVGSEMCIRDRGTGGIINLVTKKGRELPFNGSIQAGLGTRDKYDLGGSISIPVGQIRINTCLLYTSDAADE